MIHMQYNLNFQPGFFVVLLVYSEIKSKGK